MARRNITGRPSTPQIWLRPFAYAKLTSMPLTPKQQRFVEQYVIDFNAAAAARRAGYSARTAKSIGHENLTKPDVAAEIKRTVAAQTEKATLTAHEAWLELSYIARSSIAEIFDCSGKTLKIRLANEIPESARRAIKSMKVVTYTVGTDAVVTSMAVTFWDKPRALFLILKALGELEPRERPSAPFPPFPMTQASKLRTLPTSRNSRPISPSWKRPKMRRDLTGQRQNQRQQIWEIRPREPTAPALARCGYHKFGNGELWQKRRRKRRRDVGGPNERPGRPARRGGRPAEPWTGRPGFRGRSRTACTAAMRRSRRG
jgi:phage terminase small subunit